MALKIVPVTSNNFVYEFRTALDNVVYSISIRYNSRSNRWTMDVKDTDDIPLVMGIPLLQGTDLIDRFKDRRLPAGHFIMQSLEDETREAGREDLGENSLLLYEDTT